MDKVRKQRKEANIGGKEGIVLSGLIAIWRTVVFSTVFMVLVFITFMLGVVFPAPAGAETIFATAVSVPAPFTNRLISFDSTTPGTIKTNIVITGLATGTNEAVIAIDFRPSNGKLYALTTDLTILRLYTINTNTAVATQVGSAFNLDPAAQLGCVGFDIDPVSDVIRVVTGINNASCPPGGGNNYTIIPDTAGVVNELPLAFNALDLNSGVIPDVEADAYSNNVSGATTTTLFGIDLSTLSLVTQGDPNPNDGQLFTIGLLGAAFPAFPALVGFDISQSGRAFVSNSNGTTTSQFFTIDLTTGLLIFVGTIGSEPFITDISAAPANNGSGGGGCAIGGPVQVKAGGTNVVVPLMLAFVIGLRVVLKRKKYRQ